MLLTDFKNGERMRILIRVCEALSNEQSEAVKRASGRLRTIIRGKCTTRRVLTFDIGLSILHWCRVGKAEDNAEDNAG
jgi:hypothetical protein